MKCLSFVSVEAETHPEDEIEDKESIFDAQLPAAQGRHFSVCSVVVSGCLYRLCTRGGSGIVGKRDSMRSAPIMRLKSSAALFLAGLTLSCIYYCLFRVSFTNNIEVAEFPRFFFYLYKLLCKSFPKFVLHINVPFQICRRTIKGQCWSV